MSLQMRGLCAKTHENGFKVCESSAGVTCTTRAAHELVLTTVTTDVTFMCEVSDYKQLLSEQ